MEQIALFIFSKQGNNPYSTENKQKVYITTDIEDGIASCKAHRGLTDMQAKQIRMKYQSGDEICTTASDSPTEWIVEEFTTCTFCD